VKSFWNQTLLSCLLLCGVAVLPTVGTALLHPKRPIAVEEQPESGDVFLEDVLAWGAPVRWIDAREEEAFEQGHLKDAYHLSPANWNTQSGEFFLSLNGGERIVIYCADSSCGSSRQIANRLRNELGIQDVYVLQGGWSAIEGNPENLEIE